MNLVSFALQAMEMARGGELNTALAPVLTLIRALASYPDSRPLYSEADLSRFLVDHERINQALAQSVERISGLSIWEESNDPTLADLPSDCRDGLTAWFADLGRIAALHENYTKQLHTAAAHAARLELESAGVAQQSSAPGPGGELPPGLPLGPGQAVCVCGRPATERLDGLPTCSACVEGAAASLADLFGGNP